METTGGAASLQFIIFDRIKVILKSLPKGFIPQKAWDQSLLQSNSLETQINAIYKMIND